MVPRAATGTPRLEKSERGRHHSTDFRSNKSKALREVRKSSRTRTRGGLISVLRHGCWKVEEVALSCLDDAEVWVILLHSYMSEELAKLVEG